MSDTHNYTELLDGVESIQADINDTLNRCEAGIKNLPGRIYNRSVLWNAGIGETDAIKLDTIKLSINSTWPVGKDYCVLRVLHKYLNKHYCYVTKSEQLYFSTEDEALGYIENQKNISKDPADVLRVLLFGYKSGAELIKEVKFA